MTGALVSVALAVLLWPDRRSHGSRRAALLRVSRVRGLPSLPRTDQLPIPLLAVSGAVGVAAVGSTPLVALLAGILALAGARSWAAAGRRRSAEEQLAGLTEGLGALAAELRSGRSLEAATTAAAGACGNEECGRLLARAVRVAEPGSRSRAGPSGTGDAVDGALDAALDRLSAAVLLSIRTGCSLASIVAAVDGDLRARRRHRQELRAAVAAPRASALLLAGLPLLGLAMGSGIGADPWRVLTSTGSGQTLLVAGVAFELAGLAWSRHLVERVLR